MNLLDFMLEMQKKKNAPDAAVMTPESPQVGMAASAMVPIPTPQDAVGPSPAPTTNMGFENPLDPKKMMESKAFQGSNIGKMMRLFGLGM